MAGRALIPQGKERLPPVAATRDEAEVSIVEVGPRDGLQSEPRTIDAADKILLIEALATAGCRRIEAASFVSPRWVPQMIDSDRVMASICRRPGVSYSALVPNLQGYERARSVGIDEIAVLASASEEFSQRNTNASIAEALARVRDSPPPPKMTLSLCAAISPARFPALTPAPPSLGPWPKSPKN